MSSRFHSRDSRSNLFSSYDARSASQSPHDSSRPTSGYSYGYPQGSGPPNGAFSAYPDESSGGSLNGGAGPSSTGYRAATPDSRGRYSDAVLSELESQNEEQVGVITSKVKMLKSLSLAIGDEIRDSTALAEKMNDSFDSTRNRLRGTMNRMLLMAKRTGIPLKVWLAFFIAVVLLFWYVWLF